MASLAQTLGTIQIILYDIVYLAQITVNLRFHNLEQPYLRIISITSLLQSLDACTSTSPSFPHRHRLLLTQRQIPLAITPATTLAPANSLPLPRHLAPKWHGAATLDVALDEVGVEVGGGAGGAGHVHLIAPGKLFGDVECAGRDVVVLVREGTTRSPLHLRFRRTTLPHRVVNP